MQVFPRNFSSIVRQFASLTLASTLAWDYARSPDIASLFSTWTLLIHFTYFQLPLQSRAIPYFHATSFVGANVIPVLYGYLILWKPRLELDHMDQWELQWQTVLLRAVVINLAPLIFHSLDVACNQNRLIALYHSAQSTIIAAWTCLSFGLFAVIHHLTFPVSDDDDSTQGLQGISKIDYIRSNKVMFVIANGFAVMLLYLLIFRKSIHKKHAAHALHLSSTTSTTSIGGVATHQRRY